MGHLSLYRNTPECNQYYKLSGSKCGTWKDVVTNPDNCLFDEWSGVYGIFHENNIPMFEKRIFADISMIYSRFRLALNDPNYDQQVFYWEDGHVYRTYWENDKENTEEFIYIHFKKRNLQKEDFDACSTRAFFIGPNGFEEKNGKAQIQDVERINPFHGKQFERKELKKLQRMEEKQRWKERFSRLLRKKN